MTLTKILAFIDQNTLVNYEPSYNRLFVANDAGLVKIFNPDEPDSEPISVDALENITCLKSLGTKVIVTNTEGHLAVLDLKSEVTGEETFTTIHKSSFPLRDAEVINEGNRIICGGDSAYVFVIDCAQGNKVESYGVSDKVVGISYNVLGELVSLALANGDVHIYSVINENPELVEILKDRIPQKIHTSRETIDYLGDHENELVCTRMLWTSSGENVLLPSSAGSIKLISRSDWSSVGESGDNSDLLVAYTLSPSNKFAALLFKNGTINFHSLDDFKLVKTWRNDRDSFLCISIAWAKNCVYLGDTNGGLHSLQISLDEGFEAASNKQAKAPASTLSEVDKLFLEEALDSDADELDAPAVNAKKRDALDDSLIIDEEDNEEGDEDPYRHYNKSADDILSARRHKKARFSAPNGAHPPEPPLQEFTPYSPGSTPWIKSVNSGTSSTKRRYLFMNAIGYSWSVKNALGDSNDVQKSITISFFDRSVNKDYHFIDSYDYDLCSMNERGILLGCSGHHNDSTPHKGRVFYRHHVNTSDSWDRQIPLSSGEHITSICITSSSSAASGDSIIVVGTNFGYLRFFNLYGLCINIMKVSPVMSLISSAINTVFCIHLSGRDCHSYSLISVPDDYKFYQQECNLPIRATKGPLLKGLFFNDHCDPCVVAGHDDTLVVLSNWRESSNARWVPLLNCTDAVSDFGVSESKKNWKCWPLGLQQDKAVGLILKNNDVYPGFPLPLPVELDLKLPTKCYKYLLTKKNVDEDEEEEILDDHDDMDLKLQKVKESDPEEEFLRASTLGKLVAASLNDLGEEEELMDTLKEYSVVFDKSLLKLFNSACQESRLNKAFSVVKLIKNDKALRAASQIAERHSFSNLMAKINRLREELLEAQDEEENDDEE